MMASDLITEIFNRYRRSMQRIAMGILNDSHYAEDAVSEAMIKIIKNIDMIESADTKKCANFIYTITKNSAIDFYRKRQQSNETFGTESTLEFINNIKEDIDFNIFESKYGFGEQMQIYMSKLESVDVDIIGLKYGGGFTYKEISIILGISEDAVRQRISRARKKLEIIILEGK